MASKLKLPAGTRLGRPVPVGSGLKPLGSVGLARPGGRPAGLQQSPAGSGHDPPQLRSAPSGAQRRPVGQVRQPKPVDGVGLTTSQERHQPVAKPVESTPPSGQPEVGDRVLVNGMKPGMVAFLGPTQFAGGTWAGVILDAYDGKNNGMVNGIQYFECEPNRGLFARPQKLQLVAKASDAGAFPSRSKPHMNAVSGGPHPPSQPPDTSTSFSVGDPVLVDGSKPGVIAFFGTTEFARGIWAGVVLDVPEGKNNGCVAGVQYFECEPNHGLFTRPQKLTPMTKDHEQSPARQQNTMRAPSQPRSDQSTPIDPAQLKVLRDKLKIGDRVLVGGVKEGILRYLGPTEFAKGIWVGVELEEALGKNDGAVSGKRYFQCEPRYGLFAPLPKVEKLASAADEASTPGASSSPTPPPSLSSPMVKKRFVPLGGRRPSESSATSSLDSGRQHSQDYLQGLMEPGLSQLLHEKEETILSMQSSLEEGEKEKLRLNEQLAELKRQVDDLQFRLEEQDVISGDQLETTAEVSQQRMTQLEKELQEEREEGRRLRKQLQSRDPEDSQVGDLRRELEQEQSRAEQLEADLKRTTDLLHEKQSRLSSVQGELHQQVSAEGSAVQELREKVVRLEGRLGERGKEITRHLKTIEDLRSEVTSLESFKASAQTQAEELTQRLAARDQELLKVQGEVESAHTSAAEVQRELKSSESHCQVLTEDKAQLESQLSQLTSLSGDSSKQLTFLSEQLKEKERQLEEVKSQLMALSEDSQKAKDDLQLAQEHFSHESDRLVNSHQLELEALRMEIKQLTSEVQSGQETVAGEKQHSLSLETDLSRAEEVAVELQSQLTSTQQELQEALELCGQHEILVEERNTELSSLETQIRSLTKERELWSSERSRMVAEQERLLSERDKAIGECDRLLAKTASASSEQSELAQQRRELLAEREQLLAQHQAMQTEYEKVLGEREELAHSLGKLHTQQQEALGQTEKMSLRFDSTQNELTQALGEVEHLKLELVSAQDQWEHEKLSLQEQLELAKANSLELQQRIQNATSDRETTLEQAQKMADQLEGAERERGELQEALVAAQNQVEELQDQLDELSQSHHVLEHEATAESSAIQQRLEVTESLLAERERELTEAREKVTSLSEELVISERNHEQALLEEEKQLLEEEKQLLEERVKELTLQLEKHEQKRASVVMTSEEGLKELDVETLSTRLQEAQTQLLEAQAVQENFQQTIEDYEQQIEFLNSVIADLQRKLETAEALVGLHGPLDYAGEDEGLMDQLPPPRLFCDICDVFDEHDTDDCPQQAASDSPPSSMHHGVRAPGGSDRPYCNNCEMFGHWTDECEYDVTY